MRVKVLHTLARYLSKTTKISARQHHQSPSTTAAPVEESAFKTFIKMESNNHIVMPHLDSNAMRNATTIIEVKESHGDDGKSLSALQEKYERTKQELNESNKKIEGLVKSLEVIKIN